MKISFDRTNLPTDTLHVVFANSDSDDRPERFRSEARRRAFNGEAGASLTIQVDGQWHALIGVGEESAESWRRAGAAIARLAADLSLASVAIDEPLPISVQCRRLTEGMVLGAYRFDRYKTPNAESAPGIDSVAFVDVADTNERARLAEAFHRGSCSADAVIFARDLANEPPNVCTPVFIATKARELAETFGFECIIFDEQQLEAVGFNLISAVGRGSENPPRLIHLRYRPSGAVHRTVALVGKGVTYDSGGYSMKPSDGQINMHLDMGGSAAVLGAAYAIGASRPTGVAVEFIVPTAENLVARDAFKVMDIIRGYGGTTVEIHNTDAEGRLLLADALAYAVEQEPDVILDLATLTGACVVGLGQETAGVFGNRTTWTRELLDAADRAAERMWELPLVDRIEKQLKSDVADVKNIGGRWGGAISAALFLQRFVDDTPWIHIDLAGPAMTDEADGWINKGGTGFGVLALEEWVTTMARSGARTS